MSCGPPSGIDAGSQELSGDHIPPVSSYALGDGADGYYVEFLAPLLGGERKRGGRLDATTKVGGVSAQKLRHLDVLLLSPWQVTISPEHGFPVGRPTAIRIPNPTSYLVQKVLVLRSGTRTTGEDVLYLHDTWPSSPTPFGPGRRGPRSAAESAHVRTARRAASSSPPVRPDPRCRANRRGTVAELLAGLRRASSRCGTPHRAVTSSSLRPGPDSSPSQVLQKGANQGSSGTLPVRTSTSVIPAGVPAHLPAGPLPPASATVVGLEPPRQGGGLAMTRP
jgi:hypothetical protein